MPASLETDRPRPHRQTDVLALLADGFSVSESARVLRVSDSTIEHERTALRRALRARTPPQLVALAYEKGILPLEPGRRERLDELIRLNLP